MPNLVRLARHAVRKLQSGWTLSQLRCDTNRSVCDLVEAVLVAQSEARQTTDERQWFDRIESLRQEVYASRQSVELTEFGASKDGHTPEEMARGLKRKAVVGEVAELSSKSDFWCRLLFAMVRRFKPATCVEMGTSVGISGAYQAAALQLNGSGKLIALEGDPAIAAIAQEHWRGLGLDTVEMVIGRFVDTLPGVLSRGPIDMIFIDGHHDGDATVAYFNQIAPHLSPTAVVVFDDLRWSDGMKRAWETIANDERIGVAIDLGGFGVCFPGTGGRRISVPIG